MSYSYLETETEEEIKHGNDEDAENEYQKLLKALENEEKEAHEAALAAMEATRIYCSCGSPTCFAIVYYGLPKPTYLEHIRPLESQWVKDDTARRMKQYG